MVEGNILFRALEILKAVVGMVPVDGGFYVQPQCFGLSLQGGEHLCHMLKLRVAARAIERVGAKVLHAHSRMPLDIDVAVIVNTLIECLSAFVVGVQRTRFCAVVAVTPFITAANLIVPVACFYVGFTINS